MNVYVPAGKVGIIEEGQYGTFTTPGLTNTSAFVGHLYRSRNRYRRCTFMMHRGTETDYEFFAAAEVALDKYHPLKSFWVKPLAFLVGPDPHTVNVQQPQNEARNAAIGVHRRSDTALIIALRFLFSNLTYDELMAMRAYGPRIDATTSLCAATVTSHGHAYMHNIQGRLLRDATSNKMDTGDIL